jgi:hypothetical protein
VRVQFLLAPLALAAPGVAAATTYLTVGQAQALMLPGEALRPDFRQLSGEQSDAIRKASGVSPLSKDLKAWRAGSGGWFIVDEVVGKHEFIAFAVALDATGAVKDVEILDYREAYGGQVREPAWRAQFVGKRAGSPVALGKDIKNISGATLSSKHVTDGVRRILATYSIVLAPSAR